MHEKSWYMLGQAKRTERQVVRNRVAAAGATIGAILAPEVWEISHDVSRASFAAIAVYTGLKSVHASLRDSTIRDAVLRDITEKE